MGKVELDSKEQDVSQMESRKDILLTGLISPGVVSSSHRQ